MKTILICPAIRPAVQQLVETGPLATVPMLGECLVNFWLEHVASLGAKHVIVIAAHRPERVRAAIGDGQRWGLKIQFVAMHDEPTRAEAAARFRPEGEAGWLAAPHDIVVMNTLPRCPDLALFDSYAGWFVSLQAWMPLALTPARVRMAQIRPGIWAGSGARIAATARLQSPCWIGDQVTIEADAVVGPGSILEDRAVIGAGARVIQSMVGPDTFVGRLTAIRQSLAAGNVLINWHTESVLRVPDAFLLCSLSNMPSLAPLVPATGLVRMATAAGRMAFKPVRLFTALFSRANRANEAKLPG